MRLAKTLITLADLEQTASDIVQRPDLPVVRMPAELQVGAGFNGFFQVHWLVVEHDEGALRIQRTDKFGKRFPVRITPVVAPYDLQSVCQHDSAVLQPVDGCFLLHKLPAPTDTTMIFMVSRHHVNAQRRVKPSQLLSHRLGFYGKEIAIYQIARNQDQVRLLRHDELDISLEARFRRPVPQMDITHRHHAQLFPFYHRLVYIQTDHFRLGV